MSNPQVRTERTSNYTSKWFSKGLIYLHCAPRADYKTQPVHNKTPITQAMNFIKKQSRRAGKKKKGPTIHPYVESWSLPCVELQLNTEQPGESLLNARQDIHYSQKPSSQQNRRAGFSERAANYSGSDFVLQVVFPQPPTLVFPLSQSFFSPTSMAANERDREQKVAIALRRVNLHELLRAERERISSPDKSSICQSVCS